MRVAWNKGAVNHNFFKTWSADMAYILGFITADGCIIKNQLCINISSKDLSVLKYIKTTMNASYKIGSTISHKIYPISYLKITSDEIIKDLIKLGVVSRKTGKEKWPNPPKEFIGDYVRGFLDGDGCIHKRKTANGFVIDICCSNKKFLEDMKKSMENLGQIKKHIIYNWLIGNAHEILKFKELVYTGGFCLKRKYNKIKNFNGLKRMVIPLSTQYQYEDSYKTGGEIALKEKCKELGISYKNAKQTIRRKSFYKKPILNWTKREIKLFFSKTNKEIEKLIDRTPGAIRSKRFELRTKCLLK